MRSSKARYSLQRPRSISSIREGEMFLLIVLTLLILTFGLYYLLPGIYLLYRVFAWLNERYPNWWPVFRAYMVQADYYDPMPHLTDLEKRPKADFYRSYN